MVEAGSASDRPPEVRGGLYVVRIATVVTDERLETLEGIVERLGTGEKESFHSSGELLHFITQWSQRGRRGERPG